MEMISSVPERLKELIGDKSLSEFARELGGTSKQSLSAYLKGERVPKTAFINNAAKVCGVEIAWLMGYDVPKYAKDSGHKDSDMLLLNRAAEKMSPEQRRQLIDMAKVVFKDAFEGD